MTIITLNVDMATIVCGECGGTYAITERYRQQKHDKGESWNCPYCKVGWGYAGQSRAKELENQLAREKAAHDQTRASRDAAREARDRFQRSLIATQGVVTRTKNRIKNGVCPCCKRHFGNLHQHMKTQHPDFAKVE